LYVEGGRGAESCKFRLLSRPRLDGAIAEPAPVLRECG
jgi:hypothetical protein